MYPTIITILKIYTYQAPPRIAFFRCFVQTTTKRNTKKVTTAECIYNFFKYKNLPVKALSSTRIAFFEAFPKIGNHVSHSIGIDLENTPVDHHPGLMLEIYPLSAVSD